MPLVLFLLSNLAFFGGFVIFAASKSAIHEIEAFILFLISAVLLVGSTAVEAINLARKKIEALNQTPAEGKKAAPATQPAPAPPQGVAPSPPVSRPYFFSMDGKDSGPHALNEMRRFYQSGRLTDETLVIQQGSLEWQPASMYPEICFGK